LRIIKQVRVREHGGPGVMKLESVGLPHLGAGEVLVEIKAAGVNFFDTQIRSGLVKMQPLPIALGLEGAGVVREVGPQGDSLKVGDRVVWAFAAGSYGTHALVSRDNLVPLPDAVEFDDAAAIFFQALTAHYLACSSYELVAGSTCVVHSAAGGVGSLLCQIAKLKGARVIGTVSSDTKIGSARAAGADKVVIYTCEDLKAEALNFTAGRGVDVVYDAVGLETYESSLSSLRPRGFLVSYGDASGPVPPIDIRSLLYAGSVYLTRTGLLHYVADRAELLRRSDDIFAWMAAGSLRQSIQMRVPLDEVSRAHQAIEGRKTTGKIILIP
jgi:NADPH:quinone reductase